MTSPPGQREDDVVSGPGYKAWAGDRVARAIRFTVRSSQVASDPTDLATALKSSHPAIVAMWHGQFLLVPMMSPAGVPIRTVVARHGDAEILAALLRAFDMSLIRGAGAGHRKRDRGGVHLLRSAITALSDGFTVPMTADVPPGPARQAGLGIVTLARISGRPIVPFAVASSRYLAFNTWSRLTINLPYSRIGACLGEPIHVPRDASAEDLEGYRRQVQEALDKTTRRAYELAKAEPLRATPPGARLRMGGPARPEPDVKLRLYRRATGLLRPIVPLILKRRGASGKEEASRSGERYGIAAMPRPAGSLVWFHAASVGETNAVLPLIHDLSVRRPDLSLLLTTGTVTSAELAAKRLPAGAIHQYVPLDAAAYVARFLEHWRPCLTILTESEIWPNLVLETAARNIPIVLVNARMSRRSHRGWSRRREMALALFSRMNLVLAQDARVADWFIELGAPSVTIAGNLKMDAPPPPTDPQALAALREALGSRPVFLAASTHPGEETLVAQAHRALRAEVPGLLTIIAPRHPGRGAEIAAEITGMGLAAAQRSTGRLPDAATDIHVADTIGELGTFFALCGACFMGGSLVQHGGQNPIEPIKHGSAVVAGPHTSNFKDVYEALEADKAMRRVESGAELQAAMRALLLEPETLQQMQRRAAVVLGKMTGALARTIDAILPMLPPVDIASVARSPTTDGSDAASGVARSPTTGGGDAPQSTPPARMDLRHAGS